MNLTLLRLTFVGAGLAPGVGLGRLRLGSSLVMKRVNVMRGLGSAVMSDDWNRVSIEESRFQWFLRPVVIMNGLAIDSTVVDRNRSVVDGGVVQCSNTLFLDCRCGEEDGGAIFSVTTTILRNCCFDGCLANKGGAVVAGPESSFRSTSFYECTGIAHGGCVEIKHAKRASMSFCGFVECASGYGGGIFVEYSVYTRLDYSNFSRCFGRRVCGGVALSGYLAMYCAVFDQCVANEMYGGMVLAAVAGFSLDSVVFLTVACPGNNEQSGVCVHALATSGLCTVKRCSFVGTRKARGYSLVVDGSQGEFTLVLASCCFQFPGDYFVSNNDYIVPEEENLVFESCGSFLRLVLPKHIGSELRRGAYVGHVNRNLTERVVDIIRHWAVYLIGSGLLLGLLGSWCVYGANTNKEDHLTV